MSTTIREPTSFQLRRRTSETMLVHSLIVVGLTHFGLAWEDWPACPTDMIRVKVDYQSSRCCYDITCRAGFEPKVCTKDDPNPTCVECSDGTYQPKPSMLSHHQWNRCRMRTNCEVTGMKYRSFGNTTINSICECTPGYYCDNHMCLPKGRCPVGYGRDAKTGDCLPCALGKTYSDVEHVSEPCQNVTRCKALNFRTLKPATVQSDSVCGNRTTLDSGQLIDDGEQLSDEDVPPAPTKPTTVVVNVQQPGTGNDTHGQRYPDGSKNGHAYPGVIGTDLQETNDQSNDSGDDNIDQQTTHILLGVLLTLTVIGIFAATIKWRRVKMARLRLRADKAFQRLERRYEETANREADWKLFVAAMEETSASYLKLGKKLLGENRMKELEEERKEKSYTYTYMIDVILENWKQGEGETESALVPSLLTAMQKAQMYETICLIDEKTATGSNQSTDSTMPLMQPQGGQDNLVSTETDSEN